MAFKVSEYWNNRLEGEFSLKGVGYISFSKNYNEWLYKGKKRLLNRVLKQNNIETNGKNVLDVGCGTGFFIDYYNNAGSNIVGLDIAERSIRELSAKYPQHKFFRKDISGDEQLLDEKFDVVNMWDVIYHQVDEKAFENVLRNLANVSKPGAHFLLTDFFGASETIPVSEHVVFRPMSRYEDIMKAVGFELVTVKPLFKWLNRPYRWGFNVTNKMAPLLYMLDGSLSELPKRNLSLAVWKYKG